MDFQKLKVELRQVSRRYPTLIRSVLVGSAVIGVLSVALPLWYVINVARSLPDRDAIARIGDMDQATTVYDTRDQLVFTIFKQRRIDVPLEHMSPHVVKAILAIEDMRFYDHDGFDAVRTASAALANLREQRVTQGGSTISQQLARQSFLTLDKTFRRKLQELILASRIEEQFSKDEILELYLNKVYFGDGLYGIEAASQGYFGKTASEVTVSEAALLAGLVKSPSRYAPTVNMELAVSRRNVVLQAMLDNRMIDHATWAAARGTQVELHDTLRISEPHGQYFKEQVRLELVDRFGWERVYAGGLRVYTTLDMRMQEAAETAAAQALKVIDARRQTLSRRGAPKNAASSDSSPLQAALVAMDPATGHVRALIGGRDFGQSHFNRAVQARRQPGSAFKPFVYAAALESGYTPASVIDHLNDPIDTLQGAWVPADGHSTADAMTLRTGLRTSSNRAAVRLLQEVGIPRAVQYAQVMGVGDVPSVPSLALGSGEVTLASMTAAYAAFANQGKVPAPVFIRRVDDPHGVLLYEAQLQSSRAISETTAFLMSNMLADVITAGTAAGVRRYGFTLPAAGKTGTTNDFNDAWFVGFTPKLVTGVWVGFDKPRTILPNGFAADIAVPFWAIFMKAATGGDEPDWFRPPRGVTTARVCRVSGKLASDGCGHVEVVGNDGELQTRSMVYTEYFARGTAPAAHCDLHESRGFFGTVAGFLTQTPSATRDEASTAPVTLRVGGDRQSTPTEGSPGPAGPFSPGSPGSVDAVPAQIPPPPPDDQPKKKGFWSRVFGRRNDDSTKN